MPEETTWVFLTLQRALIIMQILFNNFSTTPVYVLEEILHNYQKQYFCYFPKFSEIQTKSKCRSNLHEKTVSSVSSVYVCNLLWTVLNHFYTVQIFNVI